MKKIKLVALICAVTLMLASCGNMDMMGIGTYSFNKIHIDTYGYSGCVEISSWIDNDRGVEVRTMDLCSSRKARM